MIYKFKVHKEKEIDRDGDYRYYTTEFNTTAWYFPSLDEYCLYNIQGRKGPKFF